MRRTAVGGPLEGPPRAGGTQLMNVPAYLVSARHIIIKKEERQVKVVIDKLANFLFISPNQTKSVVLCLAFRLLRIQSLRCL